MTKTANPRVRLNKAPAGASAPPTATAAPTTTSPAAPTVTQEIIDAALKESVVWEGGEEGKGRRIVLRRPSVFTGPKWALAVGNEAAQNAAFMQMIEPLQYVAEIAGDPIPFPLVLEDIEALAERLGHDGMGAVNLWFITYVMQPMLAAVDEARKKAALKNG